LLVLSGTLTFSGSLEGDINTIGNLWGTLTIEWQFEKVMCIFPNFNPYHKRCITNKLLLF